MSPYILKHVKEIGLKFFADIRDFIKIISPLYRHTFMKRTDESSFLFFQSESITEPADTVVYMS